MSDKPVFEYQVVYEWNVNKVGKDQEDLGYEQAVKKAEKEASEGETVYITKVIEKYQPKKKEVEIERINFDN